MTAGMIYQDSDDSDPQILEWSGAQAKPMVEEWSTGTGDQVLSSWR